MGRALASRIGSSALRLAPHRSRVLRLALLWLGLLSFGEVTTAWARSEAEVGYTREQTFSAALRYLRVDLAYEVTEKDPDAAYLLFNFADPELGRKPGHGSIELVQRERGVRIMVNLPDLPSYREELLKRGLLDKLRTEYGEPSNEPPPQKPPSKKRDPEPKDPAPDAPKEDSPET
jgi:hypothetical protein